MIRKIAIVSIVAVGLASCADGGTGPKQTGGAILGGLGGAVAGAQFGQGKGQLAAVVAGTLLGALIGSEVGRSLDKADKLAMARTTQNTLEAQPIGTTSTWVNPDSGNRGTVTPTSTYQAPDGRYCREFTQTVTIGGNTEDAYGKACRQPDGSWEIVN
ncbi:MAG: glycine zipper 2TM domain-containing protein [Alphaproteobacteria bacterium]|nr:glycine zipper 2TM domain-containing protein [Alphaproteobacteria bacterium]